MKCFSSLFLILFFTFLACKNAPVQKSGIRLIEYPAPFYDRNDSIENNVFYGIQTAKFIYVRNLEEAWLLYDLRIESSQLINLVGLDEYIFIQSDLEIQFGDLLEIRKYNRNFINIKSSPWNK